MSALDIFQYAGQQVRTVVVDGEVWFVASDVASVLGYRMASDMTRNLDADEKGTQIVRTPSGDQSMTVVTEPGLYEAILRSRIGAAREFKRWVKHEVLPSIRRTGQFGSQLPASFAEALELAASKVREIEALEAKAIEDAPKVAAYDQLMDAEGFYSMDAVAKLGGIGRTTLFRNLRDAGVIEKFGRLPMQRYAHWFKVTTRPWEDREGIAHLSQTSRVRPEFLTKVLAKAGVDIAEAVAS